MKCVFDENLPKKLCKALDYLEGDRGFSILHITDLFSPSTSDVDWITQLGDEGDCFVVTKDNKIKRNPGEIQAWKESRLSIVFLQDSWFNLPFWDICWKFIKIWPKLKTSIQTSPDRKSILVHIRDKIELLDSNP